MMVALAMALVVAASLAFHFLSPWRPTPIASNWSFIDDTLALTFIVTTIGFVAVILFMSYCLYRFRHQPGRRSTYEPENRRVELLLGGLTTIAVIILLAPGLSVWGRFVTPPEGAMEVEAVGAQWSWSFRLPGSDNKFGATDIRFIDANNALGVSPADPRGRDDVIVVNGELHLPEGKPVKVLLRSIDVLHDFYVPQIRAKMDLVPGMETYFWFTPTKTGQFEILCVAYCGVGHPQMRGMLVIDAESDYRNWLAAQPTFAKMRKAEAF
ncbi:cytochrome c oxidase subunit II [Methylocystis parvus]|uniref:cytochrome-c oxidase n=1 Tax=Methylocystis parvus TaxID=134 RepID=A0A6B8M263_9HYPH|nr:cytochrome c oxidase subunit II [Methylocystis parvus]QGM96415.1 cytochrome c oxidase subunit II [Methylocystis parvus]WBJ99743.1 cytochrome c oxidase subunit II [Methylocystis parvus OBBP]